MMKKTIPVSVVDIGGFLDVSDLNVVLVRDVLRVDVVHFDVRLHQLCRDELFGVWPPEVKEPGLDLASALRGVEHPVVDAVLQAFRTQLIARQALSRLSAPA